MLSKPFVSYVGLSFCWFCFSLLSFYFLLLLFDKSSCYVLVFVFVVLGFLGLVMCYVLCFFLDCFWFGFLFGGFKGQVRWPKGPPQLAQNPPYLFCFVFGLFLFVLFLFVLVVGFCLFSCWVLFVLLFCFCFIWKGLRVKWGGPLGHLTWPFVFGLFLCVLEWTKNLVFPLKKVLFIFVFCLTSLFTLFFLFLTFFFPVFFSFLLCFVSFFLSFLLSFSRSFSLSPFLCLAFFLAFFNVLFSCLLSLPLFLFFVSSCLSCLVLLFLSFCFPCLLEQC